MKTRTISGACFVAIITGFFVLRQHVDARLFLVLLWLFCAIGTFETARAGKGKTTAFEFYSGVVLGVTVLPVYFLFETLFASYGQMLYEFRKTTGITPTECRQSFLNDEIDHTSKLYKSVAVRIDEEDFMLDDDAFYHSFFKKNIESKTQKILKDK